MARAVHAPGAWDVPNAQTAPWAVVAFALVAFASITQGLGEFTLPLLTGGEPFAMTRALAEHAGAAGLFGAILLHNVGLALLLPGCGLIAAAREPDSRNRRLLAPILIAALLGAIGTGIVTLLLTAPAHRLAFLLPLAAAEATAILGVAFAAHRQMRSFGPGPANWRDARRALHALRPTLRVASAALVGLALAETWFLLG